MPEKFQNKYRIDSTRLKKWDYGWNAFYFVTICTQNRECFFGEVLNGKDALPCVSLSPIVKIVESEWLKTFEMRPDMNLKMGCYVVMPNHFHAIIGIGQNEYNTNRNTQFDTQRDDERRDAMHCISNITMPTPDDTVTDAMHCVSTITATKNQFGQQSKNLASIIRGFKIGVTKNARLINQYFAWQPRYHDHIIRNDLSFHRISEYIKNNPSNWKEDKFHE